MLITSTNLNNCNRIRPFNLKKWLETYKKLPTPGIRNDYRALITFSQADTLHSLYKIK